MAKDTLAQKDDPKRKSNDREHRRNARQWQVLIGVGVIIVLAVAAFIVWPRPQSAPAASANTSGTSDEIALGSPTAKVTIVEYGDFGCTTCKAWQDAGILDQVRKQYGDNVRFAWRDFPVITDQSPKAAEAARCANDQGRFWEYHDLLYARQPALDVKSLKAYATQLGLDTNKFSQCLDSGQHKAAVDDGLRDALAHGFRGTPAFLVNDNVIVGGPSLGYLQKLIDPILASSH